MIHFNVTEYLTAFWTAQQLIKAFPGVSAPCYLLRDRDRIYGDYFRDRVKSIGIQEVLIARRSSWQNAFVERLIGSIRRECLDHIVVLEEKHLRRILKSYFSCYHSSRTHLSLQKDSPWPRAVQAPELGHVIEISEIGRLHHRYEQRAA